jgi:succinate dehydrogenase / fumarate reductase, flavoprotein subunit
MKLVNPANKRKFDVIVVGTGLAGARPPPPSASSGLQREGFTLPRLPRRAHSIAAQGGINAAKNYKNDGDSSTGSSTTPSRAATTAPARPTCTAWPRCRRHHRPVRRPGRALRPRVRRPARQPLLRRRPGVPHLLRPGPDRPAAPARRLPGADAPGRARHRRAAHRAPRCSTSSSRTASPRHRGHPRPASPARSAPLGPRRAAVHRRLRQRLLPVDQRHGCNVTAAWRAHRKGAASPTPATPRSTPPASPPRTSSSRSSRSCRSRCATTAASGCRRTPTRPAPDADPRGRARLLPRAQVPELRQPGAPRRRLRNAKTVVDEGRGVGPAEERRVPRLRRRHQPPRRGRHPGALREPVRHVRAHHRREPVPAADAHLPRHPLHDGRAVGGLRPHDHVPGLFVLGEANFSDHGANRLGASALMQGLADGYFVIPTPSATTWPRCSARAAAPPTTRCSSRPRPTCADRTNQFLSSAAPVGRHFHRELGKIMWDYCGMARNEAGLEKALSEIPALREEFEKDVRVLGTARASTSPSRRPAGSPTSSSSPS